MPNDTAPAEVTAELRRVLNLQRAAYLASPNPDLGQRKADLRTLKRFVLENKDQLCGAINADYGHRSRYETLLADILPTVDAIDHALHHLHRWMRPQRRSVDVRSFLGARNRILLQPLGVVGVIVPFNFPLFLSLGPLTDIFAAGNRAMVKMSENSRNLARFLIRRVPDYFPPEKLMFFDETGGVGAAFSQLPFDHLLFTGSGQTGRSVMAAAAQNLCPVTLELGGKSPAIVSGEYPLRKAAERILYAKCFNAGQACVTVDYAWLPEKRIAEFVAMSREIVGARFRSLDSPDYTSIIDERAFARLREALDEARARGAQVLPLLEDPPFDAKSRKIAPHIVLDAPLDCELLSREIFGPVLPVLGYTSVEAVIAQINAGPRPLAVYPFSDDQYFINRILERVMSGGVAVNDATFQAVQHDMPFGGIGGSGMGQYHGREGFLTFSKMRPVFCQARLSAIKFLAPPYGRLIDRVLSWRLH